MAAPTPDPAAPSGAAEPATTVPEVTETPTEVEAPPQAPEEPALLPTEEETAAATLLRETTESVEAQEAAANVHADSIANHTLGLLHSDTVIERAADIPGAGPRWEQTHTSL